MSTTTIKVPVELRDRINRDARQHGLTAAGLLEKLIDSHERQQRMAAVGRAMKSADSEYWDEFRDWEVTLDDGSREP